MKTRWITAILIGSAFAAGYAVNAHAYASKEFSVPKSYGTFKAVYYDQLLFEDDKGVIRSVYPGGTLVFVATRR